MKSDAEDYTPNHIEKVMVYDVATGKGIDRTADVKDDKLTLKSVTLEPGETIQLYASAAYEPKQKLQSAISESNISF